MKFNKNYRPLDPDLVLYLPFYEMDGAGFTSRDKHGHLCLANGAAWTPQGRNFDGVDDWVGVDDDILLGRVPPWSLETWHNMLVNQPSGAYGGTLYSCAQNGWIQIFIDRATLKVRIATSNPAQDTVIGTIATAIGRFHHVVVSCAGPGTNETSVFIDGNLSGQLTINTVVTGNTIERLGWDGNPNRQLNGTIGEVALYNRALTPAEVLRNYEATKWRYR
jgi:hypothetical protein